MRLILGSSSPWRQALLRQLAPHFAVVAPEIDEQSLRHPDPARQAQLLARKKCEAIAERLPRDAVLITADQVVAFEGEIREKPASIDECRRYLQSYNPRSPAETFSALVVRNCGTKLQVEGVDVARQYFKLIPECVIEALLAEGSVLTCAGGFRMEHPLLAPYLLKLEGTADSIQGLPLELTAALLREVGFEVERP